MFLGFINSSSAFRLSAADALFKGASNAAPMKYSQGDSSHICEEYQVDVDPPVPFLGIVRFRCQLNIVSVEGKVISHILSSNLARSAYLTSVSSAL